MTFKKPDKHNLFINIWKSMNDSNRGLAHIFRESGTVHQLMPFEICISVVLGIITKLIVLEWVILAMIQYAILLTETINSAIEEVNDLVTLDDNLHVKRSKDMASGAVWLCHILCILCGFGFPIMHLCNFQWWTYLIPG